MVQTLLRSKPWAQYERITLTLEECPSKAVAFCLGPSDWYHKESLKQAGTAVLNFSMIPIGHDPQFFLSYCNLRNSENSQSATMQLRSPSHPTSLPANGCRAWRTSKTPKTGRIFRLWVKISVGFPAVCFPWSVWYWPRDLAQCKVWKNCSTEFAASFFMLLPLHIQTNMGSQSLLKTL